MSNSKAERRAERALEQARDDHFQQACSGLDVTAESNLTCDSAFEQKVPYGFCRYRDNLQVVNRLLAERGLEIALMDVDFGSEIAFVIREKATP
jgi:hypothetical protein